MVEIQCRMVGGVLHPYEKYLGIAGVPTYARYRLGNDAFFFLKNHFKDRRGYLWWSFPLLHVKVLQGSPSPVSAVVAVPEWPADGAYPPAARRVLAPFLGPTSF